MRKRTVFLIQSAVDCSRSGDTEKAGTHFESAAAAATEPLSNRIGTDLHRELCGSQTVFTSAARSGPSALRWRTHSACRYFLSNMSSPSENRFSLLIYLFKCCTSCFIFLSAYWKERKRNAFEFQGSNAARSGLSIQFFYFFPLHFIRLR